MIDIDSDKIITEGKFDENLFEDPALVLVDLVNEEYAETDEDIMLGESAEVNLIDIVLRDDPEMIKSIEETLTYMQVEAM